MPHPALFVIIGLQILVSTRTVRNRLRQHWMSCEKRSMRCGVICHSSMSDVWFTVCGGEWQQLLRQMVAPHITDCYSVFIVKFLFVYLPLRDLIVIYRFLCAYVFTQINKLFAEDSYCSYRFSVHFLLDCLHYSAICTKSGNFGTLGLGTLENNHYTPGLSISFQFCRKLTKHLLYHIANFDGGTQCVIWGAICIFMESTSCSSGCAPSPWTAERGRSFTSPGFSLCLLSILYTVLCDISIVWAMCDTVAPAAFIPMTCHRWLMVLFHMTKSNWTVTKSWLLGWPKLCWFQLYCSKTIWSISLIFAKHISRYMHIILTIFQEATQCLTLWKISLENFCKNFFPGVYIPTAMNSRRK